MRVCGDGVHGEVGKGDGAHAEVSVNEKDDSELGQVNDVERGRMRSFYVCCFVEAGSGPLARLGSH